MVFNMVVGAKDLLRYVCEKFGILSPEHVHKEIHDYLYALEQFLNESYRNGLNAALIIDEAQNLSTEVLENVRLLSNFETVNDKLLQIFLVGQPELGTRLNASELRQLKQRIALRHHLRPLNLTECKDYISRRLEVAEGNTSLFTTEAVEAIQKYACGIPRIINILCDNGLLTAYALRKSAVEPAMIAEVAQDLQLSAPITSKAVDLILENGTSLDRNSGSARLRQLTVNKVEPNVSQSETERETLPDNGRFNHYPIVSGLSASAQPRSDRLKGSGAKSSKVSSPYIEHLISVLTEAMGPMASVILREQIVAMGESVDEFPKLRLAELVEELTGELLTESAKAKCKYAMLDGIRRIDGQ
jgi:hypothetical protein